MSEEPKCTLCPKGWAWCVEDCDFVQNCEECEEPLAPIKKEEAFTGVSEEAEDQA